MSLGMSSLDLVVRALDERDCRPKGSAAKGYRSLCPAHDNVHRLSLAVTYRDGRVLLYCHAGCDTEAVLGALALTWEDLFDEERVR